MSSLRSVSVREQLAAASTAASGQGSVTVTPNPGPGAPRSLFGRIGIRKTSILSLTSPHASSGYSPATARTFSLDDLLKPPPRRKAHYVPVRNDDKVPLNVSVVHCLLSVSFLLCGNPTLYFFTS